MNHLKFGLIIGLSLSLAACDGLISERGNGNREEKTFTVGPYNAIEISGAFDVTLTPSESNEITVETDENLFDYLKIDVKGRKLLIGSERNLSSSGGINIKVPVNNISEIFSSGAANISSDNPVNATDLLIILSGAGKIDLMLDVKTVELDLSGAAMVILEGVAREFKVTLSGAGSLEAEDLEVENCSVDISGIGSAMVNVTGSLEAKVSGLGNVEYTGNPASVKGDVSGVGEIKKSNN